MLPIGLSSLISLIYGCMVGGDSSTKSLALIVKVLISLDDKRHVVFDTGGLNRKSDLPVKTFCLLVMCEFVLRYKHDKQDGRRVCLRVLDTIVYIVIL